VSSFGSMILAVAKGESDLQYNFVLVYFFAFVGCLSFAYSWYNLKKGEEADEFD